MASPAREARNKAQQIWPGATVVGRGPGWILHQHPTNPNRFMLDTQAGNVGWHYGALHDQEIDTAWVPSSGNWDWEVIKNDFHSYVRDSVPVSYRYEDAATGHYVELTVTNVLWANDVGQTANAANFVQVTPLINDSQIEWHNIATGWSVRVQAQTRRLAKWLDIISLAALGSPSVGGSGIALRLYFAFQKSNNLGVFLDGNQWDEKNNTSVETSGDLEFRDETTGQTIFWFKKPNAFDDENSQAPIVQRIRKSGANLYVEVDVPWTWLQSAAYPITIDPSVDVAVGASLDDALQYAANGTVEGTGTQPRLATDQQDYTGQIFDISEISSGYNITYSDLTFRCSNSTRKTIQVNIYCEDTDTPVQFPAYEFGSYNISNRSRTTNYVYWNETATGLGYDITSDDISVPVQDVVDRSGFSGYLDIIPNAVGGDFQYWHFDGDTTYCPRLHVEYTTGATTIYPSGISSSELFGTDLLSAVAYPDSDISIGSWTDQSGGTTNLYDAINEINPSDSDYVKGIVTGTDNVLEEGLTNVPDPNLHIYHQVRYRYRKLGSGKTAKLTVVLVQGTTTIASWIHNDVSESWANATQTLTEQEASNITDYADLRLRFVTVEV